MQKKNKATTSKNKVETNQTSETNYYDIISLLFLIGLFLIDFMPLFGSIEILGPQFIYLSILNSVIGFYIYKNPSIISEKLIFFSGV